MANVRLLIAEDHKEMREKTAQLLAGEFDVVGTVPDGQALIAAESSLKPEVCVVDISMPILSGIEVALLLRQKGSAAKIIFLTAHGDADFLEAALEVGARGYVLKSSMASDLLPAIREAISGKVFISPTVAASYFRVRQRGVAKH